MELDYDSVLSTIKEITEADISQYKVNEINIVAYNIVFLIQNEEYSVRDYALYALKNMFCKFKEIP